MAERPDLDAIRADLAETQAEWDRTPNPETRDRLASTIADMYLRDTLPALLAYIAELEAVVLPVTGYQGVQDDEYFYWACGFCGGCSANDAPDGSDITHHPACPVTQARALNIPPATAQPA